MSLPDLFGIGWRFVGPYRGGRVMATAGHPTARQTFYFGTSGGGVWQTTDGGMTWDNISDGTFKRASVGSLAVSGADPNVVYVGMGECSLRANIVHGDGVYRSSDGGQTWHHLGLAATHNIARVRVHPDDPDIVFVAAFGHRFGRNEERGIYRSRNGGVTWDQLLFRDAGTGAIDLSLDASNPRRLYAALWEAQLFPWGRSNGGPGSSIHRSDDGGATWTDLTSRPGFPSGIKGRIGISASAVRPGRVWAIVDADEGGIYRSDDGGDHWGWLNDDRNFLVRPWYFGRIEADPHDPDTVWVVNRKLWKSVDGGRTFAQVNVPYVDQQDLWIDPIDPDRMILGNDGGASVSFDRGATWSPITNQPTAEIYRVAADTNFPYRIYGSQQDNSTISLPSRSDRGPISQMDWYDVGGGESGFIVVRPDNPNIVYSGDLPGLGITRYDHSTHEIREISPWAEPGSREDGSLRYRFHWSTPVALSPHNPNRLYVGGNHLFRSDDEGQTWDVISPDLTRNDPAHTNLPNGRNRWADSEANHACTIATVAESPISPGVLWVGSDDGRVHLSRDDGASWTDVTPDGLPAWSITQIEPSPHDAARAFLSASAHSSDDFRPYVFRTSDAGRTWTVITTGIPDDEFVRVVREDPVRPGLLYAGTEAGLYVSFNAGDRWHPLQLNLPVVAIHDIVVKESDLIVATHGRGIWLLDDLSPLRAMTPDMLQAPVTVVPPNPVYRVAREVYRLDSLIALYGTFAAANPPSGILVHYHLREPADRVTISLLDVEGNVISCIDSVQPDPSPTSPIGPLRYRLRGGAATLVAAVHGETEPGVRWGAITLAGTEPSRPGLAAGLHRIPLDIVYPGARPVPGIPPRGITAPLLVPGVYTVRLEVDGQSFDAPVETLPDPRLATTLDDYRAQRDLMLRIRETVSAISDAVVRIRMIQARIESALVLAAAIDGRPLHEAASSLLASLSAVEATLVQRGLDDQAGELDYVHYPIRLNAKLEHLGFTIARSDTAPAQRAFQQFEDLSQRVADSLSRLDAIVTHDVVHFAELSGVPLDSFRV